MLCLPSSSALLPACMQCQVMHLEVFETTEVLAKLVLKCYSILRVMHDQASFVLHGNLYQHNCPNAPEACSSLTPACRHVLKPTIVSSSRCTKPTDLEQGCRVQSRSLCKDLQSRVSLCIDWPVHVLRNFDSLSITEGFKDLHWCPSTIFDFVARNPVATCP